MQVYFSGESVCPRFVANSFKRDVCSNCQMKIQSHSKASGSEMRAALEFAVDNVPSRVWTSRGDWGPSVYVGGYKTTLNEDFLRDHRIRLIVNTAKNLAVVFGVKFIRQLEKRRQNLREIRDLSVDWVDDPRQKLEKDLLKEILLQIDKCISKGFSVLIHCAQGKSRSVTLAGAYIAAKDNLEIGKALMEIKNNRLMADPNPGFCQQLRNLDKEGFFRDLHKLIH